MVYFENALNGESKRVWEGVKSSMSDDLKKSFGEDFIRFYPITKVDEEKRMVYGIATTDNVDNQDEIVDWDATKAALPEFKKWRNLREMHRSDSAIGTIPEIEENEANHTLLIGAKVSDPVAWQKVKDGVYKGFSIGGKAIKKVQEYNDSVKKTINRIKEYMFSEISLVDRPANPTCVFSLIKRDFNEQSDPLGKEVKMLKAKADSLGNKILSKEQVSKLPDSDFGVIRKQHLPTGELKERWFPMPDKTHAQTVLKMLPNVNLSKAEKLHVHAMAVKKLGSAHDPRSCMYCQYISKLYATKGGVIMAKKESLDSKLARAKQLLDEVAEASEEGEAQVPGSGVIPTENLAPAPTDPRYTPGMEAYQGPEGAEFEEYEGEGMEGGEGAYSLGYEEGQTPEVMQTQIFEPEAETEAKYGWLGEDGEAFGDEDGEANSCPYCGTTVKMLMGDMAKAGIPEVECPCGRIYKNDTVPMTRIGSRNPMRKGGQRQTQRQVPMQKMEEVYIEELAKRDELIDQLCDRLEALENAPQVRKSAPIERDEVSKADSGDMFKAEGGFDAAMAKALEIAELAKAQGKPIPPESKIFMDKVLKASILNKVS